MPTRPVSLSRRMAAPLLGLAGLVLAGTTPALAQSAPVQTVRVRGTVEGLKDGVLTIKTKDGASLPIKLREPVTIGARILAKPDAVKSGGFLGVAAVPADGGLLKAVEVVVFPEAMRGTGEGHRPFDLLPESTMTNATVADTATRVDGTVLRMTYKGGEKLIALATDTLVFTLGQGQMGELVPGALVNATVEPQADGSAVSSRVTVDRR